MINKYSQIINLNELYKSSALRGGFSCIEKKKKNKIEKNMKERGTICDLYYFVIRRYNEILTGEIPYFIIYSGFLINLLFIKS